MSYGDRVSEVSWQQLQEAAVVDKVKSQQLSPKTDNQRRYFDAIETSTVTLCSGPAGTGKTYIACGKAAKMLRDGRIDRIVLTRPNVSCGKGYGYRPGDVMEKILPVMRPMLEALADFFSPRELEKLIATKEIELFPLDDMRGMNIRRSLLICDEAQNAEFMQLHMLLTRFAEGSRVVVSGDATQSDLQHPGENPFKRVISRLSGHPDIKHVWMTRADIVRHPLISFIDERLNGETATDSLGVSLRVIGGNTWRACMCPECEQRLWYNNGNESDEATDDVSYVTCWNCNTLSEFPEGENEKLIQVTPYPPDTAATSYATPPS